MGTETLSHPRHIADIEKDFNIRQAFAAIQVIPPSIWHNSTVCTISESKYSGNTPAILEQAPGASGIRLTAFGQRTGSNRPGIEYRKCARWLPNGCQMPHKAPLTNIARIPLDKIFTIFFRHALFFPDHRVVLKLRPKLSVSLPSPQNASELSTRVHLNLSESPKN